uniref:C3H1-type domain-containing protein n=1 Tax=Steinernema glaseri TaxID=37863 RepID=A0A1I7Z9L3_9BILA
MSKFHRAAANLQLCAKSQLHCTNRIDYDLSKQAGKTQRDERIRFTGLGATSHYLKQMTVRLVFFIRTMVSVVEDEAAGESISEVPVVEVNNQNFSELVVHFCRALSKASLIAIDLELTGLGQAGQYYNHLQQRYEAYKGAAETRSVLAVGVAIFSLRKTKDKCIKYKSRVFNFLTTSNQPFVADPDSLKFLRTHGFDFNRHCEMSIGYTPAHLSSEVKPKYRKDLMKTVWKSILDANVPIAFHNGFVDAVFIYSHFMDTLPSTSDEFVAKLSLIFDDQRTLLDSKYLMEYSVRSTTSFLLYMFRKCQRENFLESKCSRAYLKIRFPKPAALLDHMSSTNCELPNHVISDQMEGGLSIKPLLCPKYKDHGFCSRIACDRVHDVDLVLDVEELEQRRIRARRKRRHEQISDTATESSDRGKLLPDVETLLKSRRSQFGSGGSHNAGMDAFMTGFSVLYFNRMKILRDKPVFDEYCNIFPLPGKHYGLRLKTAVDRTSLFEAPCLK